MSPYIVDTGSQESQREDEEDEDEWFDPIIGYFGVVQSDRCDRMESHPSHMIAGTQRQCVEDEYYSSQIRTCVKDSSDDRRPNYTITFNVASSHPDLASTEWANISLPPGRTIVRPGVIPGRGPMIAFQSDHDICLGNPQEYILCRFPPAPTVITQDNDERTLQCGGKQYVPARCYVPSWGSRGLRNVDEESKAILSPLLNTIGQQGDEVLTLASLQGIEGDGTAIWCFKRNHMSSAQPPEPSVSYYLEGRNEEEEGDLEEPLGAALRRVRRAQEAGLRVMSSDQE